MIPLILRELHAARFIVPLGVILCGVMYFILYLNEEFFSAVRRIFFITPLTIHSLVIVLLAERVFGRESREKGRRLVALLPVRTTHTLTAKLAALLVLVGGAGLLIHGLWRACFALFPTEVLHLLDPMSAAEVIPFHAMLCGAGVLAALLVPTGSGSVALAIIFTAGVWLATAIAAVEYLPQYGFGKGKQIDGLTASIFWSVACVLFSSAVVTYLRGRLHLSAGRRALRVALVALLAVASPFVLWGGLAFADWTDLSSERDDLEICAMSLLRKGDDPVVSLLLRRSDHTYESKVLRLAALRIEWKELMPIGDRANLFGVDSERGVFDVVPIDERDEREESALHIRRFEVSTHGVEERDLEVPSLREPWMKSQKALSEGLLAGPYVVVPDTRAIRESGVWVRRVVEQDPETGEEVREIAKIREERLTVEEFVRKGDREFVMLKHPTSDHSIRRALDGESRESGPVKRCFLSPDERYLILGGGGFTETVVVDIAMGRSHRLQGYYWLTAFDIYGGFSPDGRYVTLVDLPEGRPVYELASGRRVCLLPKTTVGHHWVGEKLYFATAKTVEVVIPSELQLEGEALDSEATPSTTVFTLN